MNATWKKGLTVTVAALLLGMGQAGHTEEATPNANLSATGSTAATVATESSVKPIGLVDLRPSWTTKTGELHFENSLMLGAQLGKDYSLYGVYNFNNNLHDPADDPTIQGLNYQDIDLSLRAKINNITKLGSVALSYEPRVYLPILSEMRQKGYIASLRNYFKFKQALGSEASITLTEMPILHMYNQQGSVIDGASSANPYFENRIYLTGSVKFTEKLSLDMPVMFHLTRYNDFAAGAKNNNAWNYFAWINPEMTYELTNNFAVAVGYYSDNLVKSDLSGFDISNGLEKGVLQVSMQAGI